MAAVMSSFMLEKRPRFKVVPKDQRTLDGVVFASKREMMRYAELKNLQRSGVIADLELQPAYPVEIAGKHYCTYTADFRYRETGTGALVIEDIKSSGTTRDTAYRLRVKAAQLFHGIKVREVGK